MLRDVVVDVNVLMHADDPRQARQADAIAFVQQLLSVTTLLGVDDGFDVVESKNRSLIGHEYLANLTPTSLGYQAIAKLASSGRVLLVDKAIDQARRKSINQLVRNKRDRTYLVIAANTREHILCSHDYEDFQAPKRRKLNSQVGVEICEADEACKKL